MDLSISGSFAVTDGSVTAITKSLALSLADQDGLENKRRLRVATGTTETLTIPATTARLIAIFLTGGPITLSVGSASNIPVDQDGFLIMQSNGFTSASITNASGANVDVELYILGED